MHFMKTPQFTGTAVRTKFMKNSTCLFALAGVVFTNMLCAAQNYTVVDTGQTKCYDNRTEIAPPKAGQPFYGQDAQFQKHPTSYQLIADGLTVRDLVTGLTWQGSPDTDGDGKITSRDKLTLAQAQALAVKINATKFGGFDDWRVPSIKELQSIVDYTRSPETTHSPAIDPLFQCTAITSEGRQTDYPFYWSGTTHLGLRGADAAMYVAFGRAGGWMTPRGTAPGVESTDYRYVDVHGACAQRSDPKAGNPESFPHGRGPQGDVIRINNYVRLVRG